MIKRLLYAVVLLLLILTVLLGMVLSIAGFTKKILSMAICGIIFFLLSVVGCVCIIRKVYRMNNPNPSVKNKKTGKRKDIQCVICGKHDKYRLLSESDIGDVCQNCFRLMYQEKLLHNKKKYSISELRNMLGIFSVPSDDIEMVLLQRKNLMPKRNSY